MKRVALFLLMTLIIVALATVCAPGTAAAVPTVTGFAPTSGPPGWSVTLTSAGFTGATAVTFTPTDPAYAPQTALFTAQDDTTIVASVPFFATVPLDATVTVATPDGSTIAPSVFLIDGQVAVSEQRGSPGESIVLTGSGYMAATAVTFGMWPTQTDGAFALVNSVNAKFSVLSDTERGYRPGSSAGEELLGRGRGPHGDERQRPLRALPRRRPASAERQHGQVPSATGHADVRSNWSVPGRQALAQQGSWHPLAPLGNGCPRDGHRMD